MQQEHGHPADEDDLDRTDTLPVPPGVSGEPDIAEDAVPFPPDRHPSRGVAALASEIQRLQDAAGRSAAEKAVLVAHLREAQRIVAAGEAEVARLSEELAQARARLGATVSRKSSVSDGAKPSAGRWQFTRLDLGDAATVALGSRTRLGRASGCELNIDSPSVSRYHALVVVDAKGAVIEDLNSTNGVYVNGRKIMREPLRDGDSVTVGEAKFRVSAIRAPGAEPP